MSKKQRIEDLERRVQELERRLAGQESRQPSVFYPLPPQPTWVPSTTPSDQLIVTCGGTVYGPTWN